MATPNVPAQVLQARAQHLAVLVDTVDVYRPSTKTDNPNPFEPRTSELAKVNTQPVPALVQSSSSLVDQGTAPGAEDVKVEPYIVKVPVSADVRNGDWLTVTECGLYPGLVGDSLRVLTVQTSSVAVVTRIRTSRSVPARVRP